MVNGGSHKRLGYPIKMVPPQLPSGYVKIAIEHGPVEIVDVSIESGGFPVRCVNVCKRAYVGL